MSLQRGFLSCAAMLAACLSLAGAGEAGAVHADAAATGTPVSGAAPAGAARVSVPASAASPPIVLDTFDSATPWRVLASNQVTGALRVVDGDGGGKALCLDYDFHGVSGYVGVQRDIALEYPANYQFAFHLRGDSPANDLQFKMIDASGDNVWWVNRTAYAFPTDWTPVRYRARHITKAWGPSPDRVLRRSAKLELTVYNRVGGKGSICLDQLTFQPLPVDDGAPLSVLASSDALAAPPSTSSSHDPTAHDPASTHPNVVGNAVDGDIKTAFRMQRVAARDSIVTLDLGRVREFGGLTLDWAGTDFAGRYDVALSSDGTTWQPVRSITQGVGGRDWIALPESDARFLRLVLRDGPTGTYALAEATVRPLAFAATSNDLIKAIATGSPRGWFPRGFSGEQPYWTILGIDGGLQQGLIGEDGAVEVARGGFSIEPFVLLDSAGATDSPPTLVTWADVQTDQSLLDGYLPIPSVQWRHPAFDLQVTAFARGAPADSQLVNRYLLRNNADVARDFTLALAVRPLQVNPPSQFLSTVGGTSPIRALGFDGKVVQVDGKPRVFSAQQPDAAFAVPLEAGIEVSHLIGAQLPPASMATDSQSLASGAMLYRMHLQPGESREIALMVPMSGDAAIARADWDAAALQASAAADWRARLDRVRFTVPAQGQALVDALRTSTAQMLVSRQGPRLQPGTRSYARSWIRDGAMISEGLLRMDRSDVVADYVDYYAPFQFADGKVPCCVDDRGSDPVPENDSHGELIFNIAELYRYTGDRAMLARMWPHVRGAFDYMEVLRASERTAANRAINPAFFGMMPASISHEGYSAKPMHSYWDNFWALRGYKDAVEVAVWLGKDDEAARMAVARDQFSDDLLASLRAATSAHGIDFLPGAAELGDFDATSTTIALAPGGAQAILPQDQLHATFERYWREFEQRRDGQRAWKDYTPYEWRNVSAFVRLGWRERAWQAVQYFFDDRAPRAWNQWAEVVSHTPRKPFFLGDLPHAWVASDFVRSALDMFAYTREADDSIVISAGLPVEWFDGKGVGIAGLRTPGGALGYTLRRDGDALLLRLDAGLDVPPGDVVLPWPYRDQQPGRTTIDGKPAQWRDGELRIDHAPADVRILVRPGAAPATAPGP